jgi:hypothetical protein
VIICSKLPCKGYSSKRGFIFSLSTKKHFISFTLAQRIYGAEFWHPIILPGTPDAHEKAVESRSSAKQG